METTYLGLSLRSPLVASAGPLTQSVDNVKKLADTGVGAIVMHSMFAERLLRDAARDADLEDAYAESFAEATSYFPTPITDPDPARGYLSLFERSARAIPIPLIASLNAADVGTWTTYARQLEQAGASALECNIYFVPGDVALSGAQVEARHLEIVHAVTSVVQIPVAVKISPYLSSVGNFALQLIEAGAYGVVLFNRFLQPRVQVSKMEVVSGIELSTPADAHVPRTWIASLRNHTYASLAATSGVETADDVIAYLLAGADAVMTTSALVRHGVGYADELLSGVAEWMAARGFTSIEQFRGKLAVPADTDANAYARAGYVTALEAAQRTYAPLG